VIFSGLSVHLLEFNWENSNVLLSVRFFSLFLYLPLFRVSQEDKIYSFHYAYFFLNGLFSKAFFLAPRLVDVLSGHARVRLAPFEFFALSDLLVGLAPSLVF